MKLIVGLGNPRTRYDNTRHNVGFDVVDGLADMNDVSWSESNRFNGFVTRFGDVLLLKPTTFMNRSGVAVASVVRFYKLKSDDVWVVHDDLDIRLGKYKIAKTKGPKQHNGLLSIENSLGYNDFYRVRIGVDSRDDIRIDGADYVLMKFTTDERKVVDEVIKEVCYYLMDEVSNS